MKKTLVLIIITALFSTRAHATVDPNFPYHFNYTVGTNLIGNGSWVQAGPNPITNTPTLASDNLKICGFKASSSGGGVSFGGNGTSARANLYNIPYSSGDVFYSFILKITDITSLSASGVFFVGFNNTSGSQTTTPGVVATRLYAKKSGSGYLLGLLRLNGTVVYDTTVHNVNETLFIVGGYTFGSAARLWINPDASTFGAASAPAALLSDSSGTGDIASGIASIVLFDRVDTEPNAMILDELYVGTTWADVTPTGSPALAISSVTKNDVTGCNGNTNGSITVTPTDGFGPGPLQFSKDNGISWASGSNSYTFSSLAAGSYSIKVKDANGDCTTVSYSGNPVVVGQPQQVTISSVTSNNPTCNGCADGSITVTASGGTGGLQFSTNNGTSWISGSSPYTFSGLAAGSYTIKVKDTNSCTASYSANPVVLTAQSGNNTITLVSGPTYDSASGIFRATFAGVQSYVYSILSASSVTGTYTFLKYATGGVNGHFDVEDTALPAPGQRYYRVRYP